MNCIRYFLSVTAFLLLIQPAAAQSTIVDKYGQLSVKGSYIIGEHGDTVQLRGMSFFWSQWKGEYYNPSVVKWLVNDWKCTVVRAAMAVEHGGYLDNKYEEREKVIRVVKAAIDQGIYVIIDYHSHTAHADPETAADFFSEMAERFGKYPNVLYEIYNEPLQDVSWSKDIKPYAEKVIAAIRKHDPDNIVICGTRTWSQAVTEASLDPVSDSNTVYTLHFYAASHGEALRAGAKRAMENGVAIFVSEYGTCEYTGNGKLDTVATREWWAFMDEHKISWCNWSICNKEETASALELGAGWGGRWKENKLTPSGKFVRRELIEKNGPLFEALEDKKKK